MNAIVERSGWTKLPTAKSFKRYFFFLFSFFEVLVTKTKKSECCNKTFLFLSNSPDWRKTPLEQDADNYPKRKRSESIRVTLVSWKPFFLPFFFYITSYTSLISFSKTVLSSALLTWKALLKAISSPAGCKHTAATRLPHCEDLPRFHIFICDAASLWNILIRTNFC